MRVVGTGSINVIDLNDAKNVVVFIRSSIPATQVYDPVTSEYSPNWIDDKPVLTPELYVGGTTANVIAQAKSIRWFVDGVEITESNADYTLGTETIKTLTINKNILSALTSLPITCEVVWTDTTVKWDILAKATFEFYKIKNGEQGPQGPEGLQGLQGPAGDQGLEGPKGDNGLSTWTHIAYSNSADGTVDFDVIDSIDKAYIGMYVDNNPTDSTDPSKYKWSLIKGADGAQGVPGAPGSDGLTPYLHIAYATNSTGTMGFSITDPTDKTYIGTYTDYNSADSTTPSDYTWVKIQGPQGLQGQQGLQGLQGPKGDQGIKGDSSYTHIAYSTSATGSTGFSVSDPVNKTYIGMYVDDVVTDSNDPTKYKWTLIKGQDGSQGIQGPAGADGQTPYLHIAYATNSTGTSGFSTTDTLGKTFIGTYTDYTSADSTDPTKYKWVFIQGPQGPQGNQGVQGPPGTNYYTWVKYADTPTTGMSDTPDGKVYIGLAYNKTNITESTSYSDYAWSLIQGPEGAEGPKGADGTTTYTWVKYADDANGTNMSDSPVNKRYLGLAYNKTTATESLTASDYSWSPLYDNVQVGARNLYLDSYLKRVVAYSASATLTRTESDLDVGSETNLIKMTFVDEVVSTNFGFRHAITDQGIRFETSKKYVLSFKARGNVTNFSYTYFMRDSAEGVNSNTGTNNVTLDSTNWTTVTIYKDAPWDTATGYILIGSSGGAVGKWFEVKEIKLEQGNIATAFTIAPEDIAADNDDKLDKLTTAYTTAIGTSENTIYLEVDKKVTDSEGNMQSYTDSKVTQTEDNFNLKFTTIDSTLEGHGTELAEVYSYFDFSDEGLKIGKSDSPLQINISNEQMEFLDNGNVVAYVNGQKMYISTAEILDSIIVGNHKFEKYNTNITLVKWVGE